MSSGSSPSAKSTMRKEMSSSPSQQILRPMLVSRPVVSKRNSSRIKTWPYFVADRHVASRWPFVEPTTTELTTRRASGRQALPGIKPTSAARPAITRPMATTCSRAFELSSTSPSACCRSARAEASTEKGSSKCAGPADGSPRAGYHPVSTWALGKGMVVPAWGPQPIIVTSSMPCLVGKILAEFVKGKVRPAGALVGLGDPVFLERRCRR